MKYIFINPDYGRGNMLGYLFEQGICCSLANYQLNFKVKKSKNQFREEVLYFGKVIKGQYIIMEEDKNNLVFNQGDIFCYSGNYFVNDKHYSCENSLVVGIFGYKSDIMEGFSQRNWLNDKVQNIFEDKDLKKGIKLCQSYEIEHLLQELQLAIKSDDRLTAFVRSIDIFHFLIMNYNKKMYTKSKSYTEVQMDTVIRIKNFLDQHLDTYYSMPEIAKMFKISLSRMQSIFQAYYQQTPYRYHLNKRLEKANELIIQTDMKMNTIAKLVGFNSYNKFSSQYKNKYGCNPSHHRLKN